MRPRLGMFVVAMLACGLAGAQVILEADFDDKTVDAPIGTGGAAVGEPIDDGFPLVLATVRATPFASPSLEIVDDSDFGAGSVRFNFLADEEVTSGFVTLAMDLWFDVLDEYNVFVREPSFASAAFTSLTFNDGGFVFVSDADSGGNTLVGTYPAGRAVPLVIMFNMDAGSYDVELDGQLLVDDDTHGVTNGRGVGSVLVGLGSDSNLAGRVWVDNLIVTKLADPDALFSDGFESGDVGVWSSAAP